MNETNPLRENHRKKAIVAGHICLDITPVFPKGSAEKQNSLFIPGSLIQMDGVDIHTGGVVANTGLALKKFGTKVSMIGKIGNDEFGGLVTNILKEYGQEKELITDNTLSTSYSIVLAVPGVDRMFLHNPGANNGFVAGDIKEEVLDDAALFHFGYPPLMRSIYEEEGKELQQIFQKVKEAGVATSLDLAGIDPSSEAAQADWLRILQKTLPYVDFFMPSVEELCYMIDRNRYEQLTKRAKGADLISVLDVDLDVLPLASKCIEMGAKVVVIKCGALGMVYKTSSNSDLVRLENILNIDVQDWSLKEGFEASYVPDQVLSGTGAGDTCIGAFLSAVIKGYSFYDCIHLAAAAGAACVSAYDALSGLTTLEELKERIDKGWRKNEGSRLDVSELK